ncbi:STAS domain-containing protein [Actinoplanes sp. NEAU-A12]|uniref:STAS domain-containing protein n=1 Tax=Actinoplanes sandaracinus TaxID=3045177 RepID=A0ABT6WZM6_9ACTN|nr:ATP-binding protein [Actinoplanes sandaracinus]MDI6105212.1 STAS domain-containing protein [Actinoplanes sandaracinus]
MHVELTAPDTVRIVLTGPVILVRHGEVLALVERAWKADPVTQVFVDLSEVTSLDSSGVALLLLIRRRVLRAGKAFRLHGARPEVRRHLDLAGLTMLFGLPPLNDAGRSDAGHRTADTSEGTGSSAEAVVEILAEPFDRAGIRLVRQRLSSYAASCGISEQEQYKLVLAASEIMANAVLHGGGSGRITASRRGDRLCLEVVDHGPGIPRHYLGERPRPRPGRIGSSGLWLADQICERVDIDTGRDGTTVRLVFVLSTID